jgi:VIT1/CCC1 family predicted Fe2+/Mn2+ transporter
MFAMLKPPSHREHHATGRTGWLRASVLGANDGLVSTASLILGVASAGADRGAVITAGIAGLAAGAMSMAAGEYVSVSSQRDAERADLARETRELQDDPEGEMAELAGIYEARGLSPELSWQVAEELSKGDVLAAHARDELGITDYAQARPMQAAVASAGARSTAGGVRDSLPAQNGHHREAPFAAAAAASSASVGRSSRPGATNTARPVRSS